MKKKNEVAESTNRIPFWVPITTFILQGTVWIPLRLAMNFFVHLAIKNENLLHDAERTAANSHRGILFVVNHSSELDFIFSAVSVSPLSPRFPMYYVAMMSNKYAHGVRVGWRRYIYSLPFFLQAWGAIPSISGQKSYETALKTHLQLLKSGKNVCIFPEGKFTKDQNSLEYRVHGGALYLAEQSGALILPIHVSGAHNISFSTFFKRMARVHISYGKAMSASDLLTENQPIPQKYKNATTKLMNTLYKL